MVCKSVKGRLRKLDPLPIETLIKGMDGEIYSKGISLGFPISSCGFPVLWDMSLAEPVNNLLPKMVEVITEEDLKLALVKEYGSVPECKPIYSGDSQ